MSKPTILCVDDEKFILETLKKQIRYIFADKYRYEVAESAEEGWEVIEELSVERPIQCLIFSDYLMPDVRGDEFLIQVHQKYPEIIAVMLTGQVDPHTLGQLREKLPLHRCIHKPWSLQDIIEAVESGMASYSEKPLMPGLTGTSGFKGQK
ncbi:MAG: response regulator [Desulfococcaceae bacterium]